MQDFLNWLVADFNVYGLEFQNWMLLSGAMLVIAVFVGWQDHRKLRE